MAVENSISLNFRDNPEMQSFVDSMSPQVGQSISLVVTVGVSEYDENRLVGVITNIDRDPYGDYEGTVQEGTPAADFAGETSENLNMFEGSGYTDNMLPDMGGEEGEPLGDMVPPVDESY